MALTRSRAASASRLIERSQLQKQTAILVRKLALLALCLSLVLVAIYGVLRGDWLQAVLAEIALVMALLPEEYRVAVTIHHPVDPNILVPSNIQRNGNRLVSLTQGRIFTATIRILLLHPQRLGGRRHHLGQLLAAT